MIVEADHSLHTAREQFVFRIDARRLRLQFDVQPFRLEVAELFGQACGQINELGDAAHHDDDFFGASACAGAAGWASRKNVSDAATAAWRARATRVKHEAWWDVSVVFPHPRRRLKDRLQKF